MERALKFDTKQYGYERTPEYQRCYQGFMQFLFEQCKDLLKHDGGDELEYWTCADEALDGFEECREKQGY
jgi:hypothetical protein